MAASAKPIACYDIVLPAPFGAIAVGMHGSFVAEVQLWPGSQGRRAARSTAARGVEALLRAYLHDPRTPFCVPLQLLGTPFQRRVWAALRHIAPGSVMTYGGLARRLGSSARAVGGACRRNPVAIMVPCHRVVSANGLGGFSGSTSGEWPAIKRWLLNHEGVGDLGVGSDR